MMPPDYDDWKTDPEWGDKPERPERDPDAARDEQQDRMMRATKCSNCADTGRTNGGEYLDCTRCNVASVVSIALRKPLPPISKAEREDRDDDQHAQLYGSLAALVEVEMRDEYESEFGLEYRLVHPFAPNGAEIHKEVELRIKGKIHNE